MPRDPRKLRVFGLADKLVLEIYKITRSFPDDEKYGLVSQMRRAAVSIPTNIAEGCGRKSTSDYLRFVNIATGSAYELAYLGGLCGRLRVISRESATALEDRAQHIAASLSALSESLEHADEVKPPETARKGRQPSTQRKSVFEMRVPED